LRVKLFSIVPYKDFFVKKFISIATEKEITITKIILLTSKDSTITYCEVHKVIYIASKAFYKEKISRRNT